MPFREKAKTLFRSKTRSDSLSKTDSNSSTPDPSRWPSNVYKPGEAMPRPKYRRPPEKQHKDKLEAFSFADSWRKKSFQSNYSPMGTRAPSRRASLFSLGKKSGRSKSDAGRTNSGGSVEGVGRAREGQGVAAAPKLDTEPEQEGDDDVTNVGISRVQSKREPNRETASRPRTAEDTQANGQPNGLSLNKTMSTAHDHQPFSERDLALAMQKSNLTVTAQ